MRNIYLPFLVILLLIGFSQAQIEIDGDMLDWAGIPAADVGDAAEELGDMPGGKNYDLQDLYITSNDSVVFFRITIDQAGSLIDGYSNGLALELYLDTDLGESGLNHGWWTNRLDYLIDMSPVAGFADEVTILANIQRDAAAPAWPDGWDSVGVAQIAMNDNANDVEIAVPRDLIDEWHSVRPFIQVVGAWDWNNPDGMPNAEYGWNPGHMIDYNFHTTTASVYQANGEEIQTSIEIDGDMLDWASVPVTSVGEVLEEVGDMPTGPDFDLKDIYVTSDSDYVFVRIDIDPTGTFSGQWTKYTNDPVFQLQFETIMNDTVGLSWGNWWHMGGDYLINLTDAYNPDDQRDSVTLWGFTGTYTGDVEEYDSLSLVAVAVDENDNVLEVAVPRSMIRSSSEVRTFLYVVGDENWDNEEYWPNDITAEEGPAYVSNHNFVTGASVVQVLPGASAIEPIAANGAPGSFELAQNYPNPFNPTTNISFALPHADHVTVAVYDILGRNLNTLIDNQLMQASSHNVTWNGTNDSGQRVASGVYFYQVTTSEFSATKKMVLMK
jgi:hypothetical protein